MEDFNSKYTGEQVEALLDQVASGNAGGGGGGGNEVYIADFTIASLREGIYDGIDVECDIQALVEAMNANKVILVREDEDSSFQGVYVLNGCAEDLLYFSIVDTTGNILWCEGTDYKFSQYIDADSLHERKWDSKQDTLVSGENIKTINGESIVGEGDITIAGGSGDKGDKGDKGDTGVGVQSVKQTTTSNVDSGYNVVTVTLTDGTTSTFSVKNGSKGSTGANGTNGVSVSSVKQTTISSADGGTNVVTVTLSNGTTSTFNVKNGSKGSSGTNGTNGKDGADGEDGATFTPSVDSAGNLSWTNNKGLANPPTVNIKGPKGDKGDAGEGGGGSSGGGKEVVYLEITPDIFGSEVLISELLPNKIYVVSDSIISLEISSFNTSDSHIDEYNIVFKSDQHCSLYLPSSEMLHWANGVIPEIFPSTSYELSIQRVDIVGTEMFNVVLTPFIYTES